MYTLEDLGCKYVELTVNLLYINPRKELCSVTENGIYTCNTTVHCLTRLMVLFVCNCLIIKVSDEGKDKIYIK